MRLVSRPPLFSGLFAMAVLASAAALDAAEMTWKGNAGASWGAAENWSDARAPRASDDVVVRDGTGLENGNVALLLGPSAIRSLTVDLPSFTLRAPRTQSLQLEALHVTEKFAENGILFDGGRTPRLQVKFGPAITLHNRGRGEAGFGAATLSGDGTATFTGSGSWSFGAASGLGAAEGRTLNVHFPRSFGGTVRYLAKTPLTANSLLIEGGTLSLGQNAVVKTIAPVVVKTHGQLRGIGEIASDLVIDGGALLPGHSRRTPGQLAIRKSLTLKPGPDTQLVMRVTSAAGDALQALPGETPVALNLGGTLVIHVFNDALAPGSTRDRWVLLGDFAAPRGHFERVELKGAVAGFLTRASDSVWQVEGPGGRVWRFDESTGVLSVGAR